MSQARYNAARNQYDTVPDSDSDAAYTANGAIAIANGVHAIAKTGSLAAMTLAAPAASDEGTRVVIVSRTAFAHTVTIAAGIGGKGAGFTTLTFGAIGDCIELLADAGHWCPVGSGYGVVIS